MNLRVIPFVVAIVLLVSGCEESDRYMIAKGENGVVYRTDRRTGETVMIRGRSMFHVSDKDGQHKNDVQPRKLTDDELKRIQGRGGVSQFNTSKFSCTLYNGNVRIKLMSVTIGLMHTEKGQECPRAYKYVCKTNIPYGEPPEGQPLSSLKFEVPIVRGDEPTNHQYQWLVIGAEGIDED